MPQGYMRCQYSDDNGNECDVWYPAQSLDSDGNETKYCLAHRKGMVPTEHGPMEVRKIPRTVKVMSDEHITKLREEVVECLKMSIPELVVHIQGIEDRMKELARQKQAATIAKRNLEEQLTDEERAELRKRSEGFIVNEPKERHRKPKQNPEEKAKTRKEGFSAWAARFGMKTEDLMIMDDDELQMRIAKYKAQRG